MNDSATDSVEREPAKDRINPVVFYASAIGIAVFALWAMVFSDQAGSVINAALAWISNTFGWFYFLAVLVYLGFVIFIGFSRYGKIRLGPDHSKPEFGLLTWAAMLFSAGIGIDLLFFCVSEPVTQFLAGPDVQGEGVADARRAMQYTFLHWGISGWGVYTLVGMALAFFSYRHGLPLTIRSALFPIFGKRIYGPIGHTVDIAAVLGTVFGIATSLGIGIIQLNYGLNYMFGIPDSVITQAALAVIIVVFAAISAATGVERGIRRLSEFNMLLALGVVLFVLFAGDTVFLLNAFVLNVGDYLSEFIGLSFNTFAFDQPTEWLNGWTLFFWAWWIAWGPFVGLFLARISRGRTIGEFVAGTLILPMVFMMIWMSIMGNSAIEMVMGGASTFGQEAMNNPGSSIYLFLQNLPLSGITTVAVTILAIVFFVTSGDSGSLVLSNFTSILKDANSDAPVWMRVLWAAIIGGLTLALLLAGGLSALQSAVVVMGLPFSIVLFLMMAGLFKALRVEAMKEEAHRKSLPGYLSGRIREDKPTHESWRHRIARATSFPTHKQAVRFLEETARPAMEEIAGVLGERQLPADIESGGGDVPWLRLNVRIEAQQDFTYEIKPEPYAIPAFVRRPQSQDSRYYRLEAHLFEGSQGYDLVGYTRAQVVEDILDHFERHMHFLHTQRAAMGGRTPMPDENTQDQSQHDQEGET